MPWAGTQLEEIRNLAGKFSELLHDFSGLSKSGRAEGLDFAFVEATLDAWLGLLNDRSLQDWYGSEGAELQPQEARQALSSEVLSNVRDLVVMVRPSFAKGDLPLMAKIVDRLSELFSEVANGLQATGLLSARLMDLIVQYEFVKRTKAADEFERQAETLLASINESASKASEAATSASEAAGTTGESALASYFEKFADEEWESATKFRVWTIVLLAVGGGLAAVFLLLPAFGVEALALEPGDYVHLAQRVIVTAAVFALAAYLARQSHQHRTLANWAKALSVQLKTFEAFMAPLDSSEAKEALRAQFAARVFGEPPVLRGDTSPDDSSPVPEKLWEILSRNMGKPQ